MSKYQLLINFTLPEPQCDWHSFLMRKFQFKENSDVSVAIAEQILQLSKAWDLCSVAYINGKQYQKIKRSTIDWIRLELEKYMEE